MRHFEEFDKLIESVATIHKDSRFFKEAVAGTDKKMYFGEISSDKVAAFVMGYDYPFSDIELPDEVRGKSVVGIYFGLGVEFQSISIPDSVECILGTENIKSEYSKIEVSKEAHFKSMYTFENRYLISDDGEDLLFAKIESENLLNNLLSKVKVIHCLRVRGDHRGFVIPKSVEKINKLSVSAESLIFEGLIPKLMPESLSGAYLKTVFVRSAKTENGVARMNNLYRCVSSSNDGYKVNILYGRPIFTTVEKSKTPGYIVLTSEVDGETILVNARYVAVVRARIYQCCGIDNLGFYAEDYVTGAEVLVGMDDGCEQTGTWLKVYDTKEEIDAKLSACEKNI